MVRAGRGHLLVLSSLADALPSPKAPSYGASKAAVSLLLRGDLPLAARRRGVTVTNVRFGFVDTKMAKARWRPGLISAEQAAKVLMRALTTRPTRVSYPRRMAALVSPWPARCRE